MALDTATELVNELQRLHMAYQRLVEENSSLKTSLSEMLSIKAENASLRIKLRSAQAAPQQVAPAAKPKRPEVEEEQLSEILARSDKSMLSRQMRETKDRLHASEEKLRERDAEVARLRAELGRGARSEALEASLTAAVGRATAAAEAELRAVSDYVGETALEVAAASPARWQLGAWLEGLELTALLRDRLSVRRYLQRSSKRLALDPAPAKAEAQLCALEREFVRELGALASGGGALASGSGALASGSGGALAHEGALSTARALVKSMLTEGGAGDDLLGLVAQRVVARAQLLHGQAEARAHALAERAARQRAVPGAETGAVPGAGAAEASSAEEPTESPQQSSQQSSHQPSHQPSQQSVAEEVSGSTAEPGTAPPQSHLTRARPRKRFVPAREFEAESFERLGRASVLGGPSDFFSGLHGLVGGLEEGVLTLEAMKHEHTSGPDAHLVFAGTYGVHTTSFVEWWFVVDPTMEGGIDGGATEADREALDTARERLGLMAGAWPTETYRPIATIDQACGH
jgi:regulator of replication initiation timing